MKKPKCFVCLDKGITLEKIKKSEKNFGKDYFVWIALHCDSENCEEGKKQKYNNEKSGYYTEAMSEYLNIDMVCEQNMTKYEKGKI
jgi:hypothetical protein